MYKRQDYLWPEMKSLKADLVDEHFYRPEAWFLSQGARYDNYDQMWIRDRYYNIILVNIRSYIDRRESQVTDFTKLGEVEFSQCHL